jgi:excisionase family DNA binding protein
MSDGQQRRLLTEIETAEYLRVKPETLTTWRCTQRYALPYVRVGRSIRYRASDVEKFLASRTVNTQARYE